MSSYRFQGRKDVLTKFVIFSLGVFLNFAGYLVLVNLQSSINIENGVGKFIKMFCIMFVLPLVIVANI